MAVGDSFGIPPDPSWLAFRDGLMQADNDLTDQKRWRWYPKDNRWYVFPVADWILDDIGLPDTPAGSDVTWVLEPDLEDYVEKARANSTGPTFLALKAFYARYGSRYPGLAWTWRYGGDWRVAINRGAEKRPEEDRNPNQDPCSGLNAECCKRVQDVRAYIRKGIVTAADGQRMIRNIVADCTGANP